jgi:methionyl-tRNA synthetase
MGKFYVTTAIPYASGKSHIGNVYEDVLADVFARYHRKHGDDVYFQVGLDEHGLKIEEKAREKGISPQEHVDSIAVEFKEMLDLLNISYSRLIRTTDPDHCKKVAKIFQKLYDQGDIYKGEYEGWYCTPCESFYTESQLVDGKCPDCGREVSKAKEEAYFLKLSNYEQRLIDYIESHPDFLVPESRKNEIINNFIKPGLQDLCVSRSTFTWGVQVPFDTKHVIYVWIDALINYITFLGYDVDGSSEEFKKYWPADLQLLGKDIFRFHAIYWPIILMALDLPLPKQIFGHPWLLFSNDKMSKSTGNITYADDLCKKYGTDAIRYYCLHEIPYAQDGNYTEDLLIERINSDLANVLGNLVNRTIAMGNKYFSGHVTNTKVVGEFDEDLIKTINETRDKLEKDINSIHLINALDDIFDIARRSNKYIDETMPWTLAKDENSKARLETVIYNLLEAIRVIGSHLESFLPETSEKIFTQLNNDKKDEEYIENNEYNLGTPSPLFMRIEKHEE